MTKAKQPKKASAKETKKAPVKEVKEQPKKAVEAKTKDVALATKAKLEQEEKINFYLPLADGEKVGAIETVTINGYRTVVKKGVMQQLPKSIVNILAEHLKISAEAGKQMLIDRDNDTIKALS